MRIDAIHAVGLATLAMALSVSCDRVLVWGTTEPAPWSYVEDAWGGMAVSNATVTSDQVLVDFAFNQHAVKREDSAICVRRVVGQARASRIYVRVDRCLCGPGATKELRATFPKPRSGSYQVVYDDLSAKYPELGEVHIR